MRMGGKKKASFLPSTPQEREREEKTIERHREERRDRKDRWNFIFFNTGIRERQGEENEKKKKALFLPIPRGRQEEERKSHVFNTTRKRERREDH
jgi:hypothetical protein